MPKIKQVNKSSQEFKTVESMVNKCLRHLSKKDYGIIKDYSSAKSHARKVLEVYDTQVRSRAGAHRIMLCTSQWDILHGSFAEYDSFKSHPTIGSLKGVGYEKALFALVAHEVSHHVQYKYLRFDNRYKHMYKKPHGDGFKLIYNILRRDLVNPS